MEPRSPADGSQSPSMPPAQEKAGPAISVAGLRRDYGDRTALDGVGFELAAGESLVVLGPNGAGKTTLLRILATLLRPSGGEVARARLLAAATRPGSCAAGSATSATSRCSTATSAAARTCASTRACTGSTGARGRGADRGAAAPRSGWSAAPTSGSPSSRPGCASGSRSAAASCTSRSCCCSTSPTPTSTPRGASWPAALIGPGGGRTRVVVTHDPERHLPEADQVLRLGIGETGGGLVTPSRAAFAAILAKDLRSELRTLQSLPAMALFAVTTFVIFRFGLDRTSLSGSLAAGRALGDAAVRRRARHQPPLRRRARGGRLRRDPPGPDRPQRPLRRQGGGAARLPAGAGAGRGADLRPLLPRRRRRRSARWSRSSCSPTSASPRPAP